MFQNYDMKMLILMINYNICYNLRAQSHFSDSYFSTYQFIGQTYSVFYKSIGCATFLRNESVINNDAK